MQRPDQLVPVSDPLLEEIPEAAHPVLEQLEGVVVVGELREYDDADVGYSARIRFAASIPSTVWVGGILMSVSTTSGRC